MTTNELKELLDEFLNRWHIEDVEKMTLQEYVGVRNNDTFCQWVETRTRMLGSIKGSTSIKFVIYERGDPNKNPKTYINDNKYSWGRRALGNNRNEVFENVKKGIIEVIKLSEKGKFDKIDDIPLPGLFKWKIAFLYSNERLIPIYKKDVLFLIAQHFGLKTNSQTKISEIQKVMISNKPSNKNVYDFMRELYDRFGRNNEKYLITEKAEKEKTLQKQRKGTTKRNTNSHIRTISRSYIVQQKHNKIQEALRKKLADKYGDENVILEENYVDVKLIQPDYLGFYEVKSSSYASECVREALGQVLFYSFHDQDYRKKKIYVVGQYPANEQDYGYINYIKEKLDLEFEYLNVDIE